MGSRFYYLKVYLLLHWKPVFFGLILAVIASVSLVLFYKRRPPTTPHEFQEALLDGKDLFFAKRYSEAFDLLKYPAEHAYPEASLFLGKMYYIGLGTEKNLKKAFDQFKIAADHFAEAKYMIASMAFRGEIKGVKKNLPMSYLTESAKKGVVEAQKDLGVYSLLAKDYENAYFWLSLSVKESDERISKLLEKTKPFVSEYERSLLDVEVKDFVAGN